MSDATQPYVFVSYSGSDEAIVQELVGALEGAGIPVRWDQDLRPGSEWGVGLREGRAEAAAVLVVWSATASASSWVMSEAFAASEAGTLVPVTLDGVQSVPEPFRRWTTTDLTGWRPGETNESLDSLLDALRTRLGMLSEGSLSVGSSEQPGLSTVTSPPLSIRPAARELVQVAVAIARARGADDPSDVDMLLASLFRPAHTTLDRSDLERGATFELRRAILDPTDVRVEDALRAVGVDPARLATETSRDLSDVVVPDITAPAALLARRVGASQVWSHHVIGSALGRTELPAQVTNALGVSLNDLKAALRRGIARRWTSEDARTWDDVLGPVSAGTSPEGDAVQAPSNGESAAESAVTLSTEIGELPGAVNDAVHAEDRLGFHYYADAFADLITSPLTEGPLVIGIYGSWGMGKSFLLGLIEDKIYRLQRERDDGAPKSKTPTVHVVRFNAWEYSATEKVWPGLVRKIVEALDKDLGWSWYKRSWTRLRWNLPREIRRRRAALLASALIAGVAIGVAVLQGRKDLAAVFAAAVAAFGAGGLLNAAINPLAQSVTTLLAESNYGRQIEYMEDIKHDLDTLERRLHPRVEDHTGVDKSAGVRGRILVLIDDLDRCEPDKAVEVLQAVNLLLNYQTFIVCLGIDARIVTGAVERHYEGLLGEAGASGYEYLEKIVQIPFRIPEPSEADVMTFLATQLDNPAPAASKPQPGPPGIRGASGDEVGTQAERTPQTRPVEGIVPKNVGRNSLPIEPGEPVAFTFVELQAFQTVAPFLRPNPRHLKRLVNVYRLVRALAGAKEEELILHNPSATIRWLVMWAQWPYTSHVMLQRLDELAEQWTNKVGDGAPEGDTLLYLLGAVAKDLDPRTRDRLDDEAEALRDLLTLPGAKFTREEILRIRKYTVNLNPAVEDQLRASTFEELRRSGDSG